MNKMDRRDFLTRAAAGALGLWVSGGGPSVGAGLVPAPGRQAAEGSPEPTGNETERRDKRETVRDRLTLEGEEEEPAGYSFEGDLLVIYEPTLDSRAWLRKVES